MKKILFVCTGNICRSPTAEGVLRHLLTSKGLAETVTVDSAGTHAYHVGEAPDARAVAVARKRGVMIEGLRARKIAPDDFQRFDLILGLDNEHVSLLRRMAPAGTRASVELFLEYAGNASQKEVPDPYYGNNDDFEHVLNLIEAGTASLLHKIKPAQEIH